MDVCAWGTLCGAGNQTRIATTTAACKANTLESVLPPILSFQIGN